MYSFLKEIDKYLKENNIPFKRIEFSYAYLPDYLNLAILYEIRKLVPHFEIGVSTYELIRDNNGNLCLFVQDSKKKQNLIITSGEEKPVLNFKVISKSEKRIIRDACMLKYYEKTRIKVRKAIEENYSDYPKIEKIKCEYQLMYNYINKKYHKEPELCKNIVNQVDYVTPLIDSVEKITSYIDYLHSFCNKQENERKKIKSGISYKEPEKNAITRNDPVTLFGPSKERINEVIRTDLRFQILEEYPYIYRDYAYNAFNKEINYMAYMYRANANQYIMIMEPYNGKKYTKIVEIVDDEEMTEEKFKGHVKHYLELPNGECIVENGIIRIVHTTYDIYKAKIDYVLTYLNGQMCSNYFKEKVRKLREH